jgi:ComF family protein
VTFPVSLAHALLDLVWPRVCEGCGQPMGAAPGHVCWDCRAGLPLIEHPYCSQCGDPVEGAISHDYRCAFCVDRAPAFVKARSAVRFRGVVPALLHRFKYGAATHLAPDLAGWLEACVGTEYPGEPFDAVAFVPLHPARERLRTYNQSALLAAGLGARLRLPVSAGCLRRVRPTDTQTHLSARQRAANVRGAFAVRNPAWVEGRRFLLVDDVMTTGVTVSECASVLKDAGAASVHVVTVARG